MKTSPWLLALILSLASCSRETSPPLDQLRGPIDSHRDESGHDALPRQLRVAQAVALEAGLQTEVATRSALAVTVRLPGEVVAEPDKTARVSAATAGKLERVSFNEGQVVKKGDVLAVLRVPDVGRLRGLLAATAAKAKASRANVERLRSLKESGLGTDQAVVDADADARALDAEAKALIEQLGAIGVNAEATGGFLVPLRAPLSGVVVSRDAVVGQPINAEHVLATVVDLTEVWFLGRIFEKDLSRLRIGARSEVQLNALPNERFEGVVDYVAMQTDPVARTLTARIRLRNEHARLRIGLFGSAHVEVTEASDAQRQVVVPRAAVSEVGGKSVIFVKAKDGDFVVHEVTLGDAALGHVQVLSGLSEGEEVVTHGVFTLKSLLLKSSLSKDEH